MVGKIRNYYADGNTAKGFWSFHKSNIESMQRLFLLKGGSLEGKSLLVKKIAVEWITKGFDAELMHCACDNNCVDGVIFPQLKFGLVDASPIEIFESGQPQPEGVYIDLDLGYNPSILIAHKDEIDEINKKKKELLGAAYLSFREALLIHDEWERIYIDNMDFSKAENVTQELQKLFFENKAVNKKAVVRDRFMGGATPNGPIDYLNNLTEDINKRYFIKGRPGTGKSTMLKKLAKIAQERGFDVEIYHCGLDPNSLDMLIFRELDLAIFDSTAPHEYFPDRHNDEIVDMYKAAVNAGTDEKYDFELQDIIQRYKSNITEGTFFLKKAKSLSDDVEKIYTNAMSLKTFEEIKDKLNLEVAALL